MAKRKNPGAVSSSFPPTTSARGERSGKSPHLSVMDEVRQEFIALREELDKERTLRQQAEKLVEQLLFECEKYREQYEVEFNTRVMAEAERDKLKRPLTDNEAELGLATYRAAYEEMFASLNKMRAERDEAKAALKEELETRHTRWVSESEKKLRAERDAEIVRRKAAENALETAIYFRDEARRLFDAAMEYADSAYRGVVFETVEGCELGSVRSAIKFHKPRPVAPWKGER